MFGRKVDRRRGRRLPGMGRPSGSALATSCSWKKSGLYCIGRGADGAWSRYSHLLVLIKKNDIRSDYLSRCLVAQLCLKWLSCRLPSRVTLRHSQPCPKCRLLGYKRTSISGGWRSVDSQTTDIRAFCYSPAQTPACASKRASKLDGPLALVKSLALVNRPEIAVLIVRVSLSARAQQLVPLIGIPVQTHRPCQLRSRPVRQVQTAIAR